MIGDGSTTADSYGKAVLLFLTRTRCPPLEEITERTCTAFLERFAPRGAAKHLHTHAMRSFFSWCVRHGLMAANPADAIRLRKPRRIPPVTLSHAELQRELLAAVFVLGERVAWCLLLVYLLGVRRGEAAGLKWEDIRDSETGPVIEVNMTKGANKRTPLPLAPLALEALGRIRELPAPPQATLGPEYIMRARPQTITRWGNVAGKAAGLHRKKTGPHRLRASLATHLLYDGVDVRTVQEILGHLRLESTTWYLARAGEAQMRSALEGVGLRKVG